MRAGISVSAASWRWAANKPYCRPCVAPTFHPRLADMLCAVACVLSGRHVVRCRRHCRCAAATPGHLEGAEQAEKRCGERALSA
jgi:hypothetical protein